MKKAVTTKHKKIFKMKKGGNNKRKKNVVEVDLNMPENMSIVNVDRDVSSFIKHALYVSREQATKDNVFMYNGTFYAVLYADINGSELPVGVFVRDAEGDGEIDVYYDNGKDVNTVYSIIPDKSFKGFYILSNGAVAIDYDQTDLEGYDDFEYDKNNLRLN